MSLTGGRSTRTLERPAPAPSRARPPSTGSTGAVRAAAPPAGASPAGVGSSRAGRSSFVLLVSLLVVLNLTGLVMVLSASSVLSLSQYHSPWHFFERQLAWLAIGVAAFFVALRVDRRRWRRLARPAMGVSIALLLAVLVPHLGRSANGASRWLGAGSVQIQPSELAKLALIFFAADVLDRRAARGEAGDWKYQMVPVLVVVAVLGLVIMKQPDMGSTMVVCLIALVMLFTAGMPAAPLAGLGVVGVVLGLGLAVAAPYRWARLTSFVHPFRHASDTGYQSVQGLLALGAGGVAGDGLGSSIASWGYLPNAQTDFIFAVIGEETGLIGTLLVSGLFLAFGLVGVRIACGARDRFSGLVATGITTWLLGQAFINIGAVVGILPVTGVPLPFVSYGGTSLVIALFGAGVLGNIARRP